MLFLRGPTIFGKRLRSALITLDVLFTDSVVWVIKESFFLFLTVSFYTLFGDLTRYIFFFGLLYWLIVLFTFGCPAWPMRIDSSPRRLARATFICTLVTSGQVALNTVKLRLFALLRTA